MELLADAEEAAEADDGKHDAVRQLVEHYVFDGADVLALGVVNRRADDLRGGDRGGMTGWGVHGNLLSSPGRIKDNGGASSEVPRRRRRVASWPISPLWSSAIRGVNDAEQCFPLR